MTPQYISKMQKMITEIEGVKGVRQVYSILSVQDAFETDEGLAFRNLISPDAFQSESILRSQFDLARSNRITREKFISADGKHLLIWIEPIASKTYDNDRSVIVHGIRDVVEKYNARSEFAMGGLSVIYTALNDYTQRDVGIFFTASYIIIFIFLWVVFRNVPLVISSFIIVMVATTVSLGIYGICGYRLNLITALIPTVLIVIGLADVIHFPSLFHSYRADYPDESTNQSVIRTVKSAFFPCLLTCATNMIGFLSFLWTPISGIRQFGLFTAIGLAAAFVSTFVVMAITLSKWAPKERVTKDRFRPFLDWVISVVDRRTVVVGGVLISLTLFSIFGLSKLSVDTHTIGYLPTSSQAVQDHNRIMSQWGSYMTLEMMIEPKNKSVNDPEMINLTEQFVTRVKTLPGISNAYGISDVYRRTEEVFVGKSTAPNPFTTQMVGQLSLMMESDNLNWDRASSEFKDNYLAPFMTENQQEGRVTVVGNMLSSNDVQKKWTEIMAVAHEVFQDKALIKPSGYGALYSKITDYIIASQIRSFFYTLALIVVIFLVWTRSLRLTLIGILPNVFPVALILGIMGVLGIELDLGTAMVAAIVLGIAVDDTVHFLHYWQKGEKEGLTWRNNVSGTFHYAGRAALINSILFLVGFPVMMLSGLKTVFFFGFLTTIAAATSVFSDLFMLPLLLKIGYPIKEPEAPVTSTSSLNAPV